MPLASWLESNDGRMPLVRTAEEEIPRILKLQKSYYAVLKVRHTASTELR